MASFPPPHPPRPGRLLWWAAGCALAIPLLWPMDAGLVKLLNPKGPGWWDAPLKFLDRVLPLILLTGAFLGGVGLWLRGPSAAHRRGGAMLMLAPLLASRVTGLLKELVSRPRPQSPEVDIPGLRLIVELADRSSFPSGHVTTASAFALALLWALPARRGRWFALLLIPIMMWSRIALAVHHPSDAVGGLLVSLLVVAGVGALLWGRDPWLPRAWRVPVVLFGLLLLTTPWSSGDPLVDPVSGTPVSDLHVEPVPLRTVFEPFCGPPLEAAFYAPRSLLVEGAVWGLVAWAVLWWAGPRRERRRRLGLAVALLAVWGGLFWTGRLPPDRFVAPRGDGVFFDPHTHGSDPVDGAISLEALLARETARGVSVVAITNHDAPPPAVGGVPGMEWSGGIHPSQTFLHLLIYGGDGAIDDALTSRIPALGPDPGSAYETALDVVARAKQRGAAVIVAHYPATKRRMERDGTVHHLPSPEDLVAAGVDGFEVANRRGPDDAEAMELLRHLDDLCREHGLLRLGSSDDHGMPAGSPCITFVPGTGTPGPTPRDDVLDRLGNRGALVPVIVRRARVPHGVPPVLRGPLWAARYLLALSLWARVSWILWFLVAIRWLSRDDRPAKEVALSPDYS